jgi:hypothetical protein
MNARLIPAVLLAAMLLFGARFAAAQRADDAPKLIVRVYQLADMILPLPNHGYRPSDLPTTPAGSSLDDGGLRAFGGGFGGGGGLGGGGAAFNLQAGGFGGGQPNVQGGGGLGIPSGGGMASQTDFAADATAADMEAITELITSSVDAVTWDQVGGSGNIQTYRSMLVISQTAETHAKVDEFLNMLREKTGTLRTVTVAAHWLMLDSDELAALQFEREGVSSIDREALAKFTKQEGNFRGQITCFSGQTVHLVGGERRNVVTSVIPVVGGDNPAYQPRSGMPNMGVLLQVRPTLVADSSAAIVDLESWVTSGPKKNEMIEFHSGQISAGLPRPLDTLEGLDTKAVKTGDIAVRVDRLDIASQALATTLRAPVGVPVLAGGLSIVSERIGDGERKQLYLVVQVNVAEHARSGGSSAKAAK